MNSLLRVVDRFATSSTAQAVTRGWRGMTNLLVPNPCVLCSWQDAVAHSLCDGCTELLKLQHGTIMQAQDFAESLPLDVVSGRPLPVFASSFYTPEMSKVLLQYKDHQRVKVAGFLRPIVYRTLREVVDYFGYSYYRLIPVPATAASMRKRGHNPVVTMLPRPLPARLMYDRRTLKPRWQIMSRASHRGTGAAHRRDHSRRKFRLASGHDSPAEPVILVDDVLTTGATLAAATRALQAEGFDVVAAVVVAAVLPRH